MKTPTKTVLGAAAAVAFAATTVLAGGVAAAQIPGADNEGVVVITDSDLVEVTVDDKGEAPTQISGSITNTGDRPLRCATPGLDGAEYPGQVTEAGVVARAMNYYATHIYAPGGFAIPIGGGGPVFAGSLYDILPGGSIGGSVLGDSTAELVEIRDMQAAARLAGRTGDPRVGASTAFTLGAGQSSDWVADLAVPGTGDRGEWQAAAMFFCRHTSNPVENFVFAGFENNEEPGVL
ncbi:hypothetical protein [Dietzia psychralcaliphila]|uniref:Porin n=2 Tax=Dietzia psychralcaliphila TaxID=139021 RepID=A0AAD0NNE8_9ACTN|nr:hypothetical protein [Dietzia psychralcaliphila]AWH96580.1 hypothetical protein A6048_15020 [Dietzia psychralcaliphila]PTM89172.1 hypothetical protein C8N39_10213 [Dietzia psychralcaliphila]